MQDCRSGISKTDSVSVDAGRLREVYFAKRGDAMDTRKCQVLLKVLECGSMAGAASQFGYDPSGISRMIASMERETGFALLVRSKNGISLTKGGERLLPVIQELAHFGSVYEKTVSQILGVEEGSVLIGSAFYGLYPWLTRVIAGFSAKYPKVDSPKGEYWDRIVTESYINSMPTEDVAPVVHGKWVSITKNNSNLIKSHTIKSPS